MSKHQKWEPKTIETQYLMMKDDDYKNLLARVWELLLINQSQSKICSKQIDFRSSKMLVQNKTKDNANE